MLTFATVEEFAARHPDLTDAERDQARLLLEDATALMLARLEWSEVPHHPHRQHLTLRLVCLRIAERVWANPGGLTSEVIGDYSYRRDRAQAGGLALAPDEEKLLAYIYDGRPAIVAPRFSSGITDADRRIWAAPAWRRSDGYP